MLRSSRVPSSLHFHRLGRRILCGLAAVVLMAAPAWAGSAAPAAPWSTFDEGLVLLNEELPGFGGLFFDAAEGLHVYMVGGQADGVAEFFGTGVQVHVADYEFAQLQSWRESMRSLLSLPGVVYLDVDEKQNRVRVGIDRAQAGLVTRKLESGLAGLQVPREAVRFEETDPIYPMVTLSGAFNPVPGGVEINFPGFLCTLGFNIRFGGADSTCYFMTNSHCTNVQGGVESTPYLQPAGGASIGTEVYDPIYFTGAPCPAGRRCRYSDSSAAVYNSPGLCELGAIARTTGLGSTTVNPAVPRWKIVSKLGSPTVGQLMAKVGRTTGWTEGSVVATCADTGVAGSNITLLCQSFVNAGVGGGDSGSPVFRRRLDSSLAQLAGILWGGNFAGTQFVFSPMDNIELEVGIALPVF